MSQPGASMDPGGGASPPAPSAFRADVNAYLRHLSRAYDGCLAAGNDGGVHAALAEADSARRALSVFMAVHRLFLDEGGPVRAARVGAGEFGESGDYLVGLLGRMHDAIRMRDGGRLLGLVVAGEETLEVMAAGGGGAFAEVGEEPGRGLRKVGVAGVEGGGGSEGGGVDGNVDDVEGVPTAEDVELGGGEGGGKRAWRRGKRGGRGTVAEAAAREKAAAKTRAKHPRKVCGLVWEDLNKVQRWTIVIYLTMVVASLVATVLITKDFVDGILDPDAVLRIESLDKIRAPVMTVCTSLRALPQSRLQFFNYSDAQGNSFVGADPRGPQRERTSPKFESVVERWFDNPEGRSGEGCGCEWRVWIVGVDRG